MSETDLTKSTSATVQAWVGAEEHEEVTSRELSVFHVLDKCTTDSLTEHNSMQEQDLITPNPSGLPEYTRVLGESMWILYESQSPNMLRSDLYDL